MSFAQQTLKLVLIRHLSYLQYTCLTNPSQFDLGRPLVLVPIADLIQLVLKQTYSNCPRFRNQPCDQLQTDELIYPLLQLVSYLDLDA